MARKKEKKRSVMEGIKGDYKKNKQLYFIVGAMVFLVLVFLLTDYLINANRTFEYKGLTFDKTSLGNMTLYHYWYYFTEAGRDYKYNLYLRIDPRRNRVPVEGAQIKFLPGKFNYLSINGTGLNECSGAVVSVATLTDFLVSNLLKVEVSSPDRGEAEEMNISYADCETNPNRVVILVQKAEKTEIRIDGTCYKLNVANCELRDVIEKFEVQAILDAREMQEA